MSRLVVVVLRLSGAGLLAWTAGLHLHLWREGYRTIDTIGPLFMTDAVVGFALALAVLVTYGRLLLVMAAGGALLQLGTVVGLWITVQHGLFGFTESTKAALFWESVWVETAGTVVLLALAAALVVTAPTGTRRTPLALARGR